MIFEEEWDNLIILDACRLDLFQQVLNRNGSIDFRWSAGSDSMEFIRQNTEGRVLNDVVWVSANPWVSEARDHVFKVKDVWDTGWNEELQTVLPETMKDAAIEAEEAHPNKRLVVHFMQPHYPFIGEFGRNALPSHRTFTGEGMVDVETEDKSIWEKLESGDVAKEDVWRAYRENLEMVYPVAKELCSELTGRSVITSDHGNEFGNRGYPIPIRLFGHPGGLRTKNLVKVPWIPFEDDERKEIQPASGPIESEDSSEVIEDRLQALGYHK